MTAGAGRGRQLLAGRRLLFLSLSGYRSSFLGPDLAAAAGLLAIAIPEQLATAHLAGMPALSGYYAFVAGAFAFLVFGQNRWLSVGADSTIAPLFAVAISRLGPIGSPRYQALVALLALLTGALVALVGLLRLGWIADFFSTPIVTGFMAGVAVLIVVHQLPDFLGIAPGQGSALSRLEEVASHLGSTHPAAWLLGLGVLVLAGVGEVVNRRLPAALLALVAALVVSRLAALHSHGVAVLGPLGSTAPHFRLAEVSLADVGHLLPLAAVVALVIISQSAATTRAFEREDGVSDANRDFIGVGAGSLLAGLLGAFPLNASPPRTAVVAKSGAKSQLASLVAACVLLGLLPISGVLRYLPLSALAAILFLIAARIAHIGDFFSIARFSRFELVLSLLTLLTVALVGVEQGIAVAVGLAILDRGRRSARPHLHVLGQLPGTTSYAPLGGGEPAVEHERVLVVLFAAPLWYANALHFRSELEAAVDRRPVAPAAVVVDALGMSDIDFTGLGALQQCLDRFERLGIKVLFARAGETLVRELGKGGVLGRLGGEGLFPSVGEAVAAAEASAADQAPLSGDGASRSGT